MDSVLRKIITEEIDKIKGGLSDKLSVNDIAKKHKVPVDKIQHQLELGIDVELEHTNDKKIAREIAMDHLFELPDYYSQLKKIEEK